MKKLSIKNQEKTLKILIKLCLETSAPWLYKPINFENNFDFISSKDLIKILDILVDKELISIQYADLPNHFNINTLKITAKGYDYFPMKLYNNFHFWIPVITSNVLSIIAIIISVITIFY